ncbi:hypothetical protein [Haloarchaeobius sp. DFWS5]|uniref:hypothetical protein n=1 Tax=Haloarchaeobius sp. DFWS5 TaxID=3446114 RepID=UPI003EBD01F5
MPSQLRTAVVLAVVAMLVLSGGMTSAVASSDDTLATAADEIFVYDNGDAVLLYRMTDADATGQGTFAIDVPSGLAHVFLTDEVDPGLDANAEFVAEPDSLMTDGEITFLQPEDIEALDMHASMVQTRDEASGSLSLDATIRTPESGEMGEMGDVGEVGDESDTAHADTQMTVTSDGFVVVGSSLEAAGQMVTTVTGAATDDEAADSYLSMMLTETEDAIVITVEKSAMLEDFETTDFETEEAAQQALDERFTQVADSLGGTAEVTIDSYAFDTETNRLDLRYTATLTDVKPAIAMEIAKMMADDRDMTLTDEELGEVAAHIETAQLTEISYVMETVGTETFFDWTLQIDEIDSLMEASLTLDSFAPDADEEALAKQAAMLEAKKNADLAATLSWSGTTTTEAETTTVQLTASYETENWTDYVDELEAQDIEFRESTVTLDATTDDEGAITVTISVTLNQRDVVDSIVDKILAGATAMGPGSGDEKQGSGDEKQGSGDEKQGSGDEKQAEMLEMLRDAGFEKVKMDVSMAEGTITFEAATKFEDLTPLQDHLAETFDGLAVERITGTMAAGQQVVFVHVTGATVENATMDDVLAISEVDDQTIVHLPGTWDAETAGIPEFDEASVQTFLADGDESPSTAPGDLPGTGTGVALLAAGAVLGSVLIARTRKR